MTEINQTDLEKMSFEEAFQALEETVRKLEAGNLPLADSLSLYQRGVALSQYCNQQLDQAELSIKKLTPSGEVVDFDDI